MNKTHELKIDSYYYWSVKSGQKRFELRKNDRDFQIGDWICLKEHGKNVSGEYVFTGNFLYKEIKYVFGGGKYGLDKDYCILGL